MTIQDTVIGQGEVITVPRIPTREMLEAAWADAHDEDAAGVWASMITAWELSCQQIKLSQR